ncbi:MAG TPA: nucleoside hydrolase [Cellulomonas sp.]
MTSPAPAPSGPAASGTGAPETRHVWMDCDTGFDDFLAIPVLAGTPGVQLHGISTTVGNTSLEHVTANTLACVEGFGIDAPVFAGAVRPLAQAPQTIEGLLGTAGMGSTGAAMPPARSRDVHGGHAVPALVARLRTMPDRSMTLVATGPTTNLALAVLLAPDIVSKVREVVVMGGSTDRGNHTAAAEFNVFADPEALQVLIDSGLPLRMFGLDLTRQVLVGTAERDRLRAVGGPFAAAVADHLDFYLRIRTPDASEPMPLHDPSAVAYLAWPELYRLADAHLQVELHGARTRGQTVYELRVPRRAEPNVRVAVEADGAEVTRRVFDRIVHRLRAVSGDSAG